MVVQGSHSFVRSRRSRRRPRYITSQLDARALSLSLSLSLSHTHNLYKQEKAPPPTAPPLKSSNTFLRRNQPASNTISLSVPPKTIRQYSKYVWQLRIVDTNDG